MAEQPTDETGISVTRVFDAPRERVWREWTEPEAFADWFGGTECEVPLSTVSMDVRPGGALGLTMLLAPGQEVRWTGEYVEVAEPERLVFEISDGSDGGRYELVTVVFTDLGDGRTEMLFEQRGRMRPDGYDRAKAGWGVFFDRLAERLAGG